MGYNWCHLEQVSSGQKNDLGKEWAGLGLGERGLVEDGAEEGLVVPARDLPVAVEIAPDTRCAVYSDGCAEAGARFSLRERRLVEDRAEEGLIVAAGDLTVAVEVAPDLLVSTASRCGRYGLSWGGGFGGHLGLGWGNARGGSGRLARWRGAWGYRRALHNGVAARELGGVSGGEVGRRDSGLDSCGKC